MDLNTRMLAKAFKKLPLAVKVTSFAGVPASKKVVWDGDLDYIPDSELRRVVLEFLLALDKTPLGLAYEMEKDIARWEIDYKRQSEESEKRSERISESYNYPG